MNKNVVIAVVAASALLVGGVAGGAIGNSIASGKVAAAEEKAASLQTQLEESEAKYSELVLSNEALQKSLDAFNSLDLDAYSKLIDSSTGAVAESTDALKELAKLSEELQKSQ